MKLYERFESGELTKMTEEIVEEIIAGILNECYYYTHTYPEDVAGEVASIEWDGYDDIECIAKEYARWKMEKWIEAVEKISAKDLSWDESDDIDDIQYLIIMKIWDIESKKKKDWLREFRNSTQLPEDHPDHIDISDCSTK